MAAGLHGFFVFLTIFYSDALIGKTRKQDGSVHSRRILTTARLSNAADERLDKSDVQVIL
jgi:hypothetical protein